MKINGSATYLLDVLNTKSRFSGQGLFSEIHCCFVFLFCVEVLRPSQPNGVMSSAVSLPNHTFTGQA